VLRRLHLYTGLVLVPWVLLYGVTAFLFNHPTVATDRTRRNLTPEELESTPFQEEVRAADVAELIASALSESMREEDAQGGSSPSPAGSGSRDGAGEVESPNGGPPDLVPRNAQFSRTARLEVRGGGLRQSFSYDMGRRSMLYSTRTFTEVEDEESPLARAGFKPDGLAELVPTNRWKEAVRALAAEVGTADVSEAAVSFRSGPSIAFNVDFEGVPHELSYDLSRGTLSAEALDQPPSMSLRTFLLRLHKAHVYPSAGGARWAWALLVDVMALAMVSWGVTGLFMWWQIKRTRGIGTWLVAISLVLAGFVGAAMHSAFLS